MDFKSCFYHIELDSCDNAKCLICQAYIAGGAMYCQRCAKEKNICVICGKTPIFIPEEASRAVYMFQEGTTHRRHSFSDEVYSLKMKQYEQLVQDVKDGKIKDNASVWKVIDEIQM